MKNRAIIERWMLLLMAMLLMACGGSEEENSSIPEDEDCYLDIYVYAPDRPIVTRADVGDIKARSNEETDVKSLQIWVFKSSTGDLVGYLNAGEAGIPIRLNETNQQVFRMKVEKSFANAPEAVDVYVVANAANYVSTPLTGNTTTKPTDLDNAMIGSSSFGTTDLYGEADLASGGRIATNGLPMSAVLKNQSIVGKFPTLRIGTESQIATLHLTRAVSKLRFVLCRITESENATKKLKKIDNISLDGNLIPTRTYLIPRGTYNYTCNHDAIDYGSVAKEAIPQVANPLDYAYETQSAQVYENLVNAAIAAGNLTDFGLTYFRESDKQLTGIIQYTNTNADGSVEEPAEATFSMAAAGDFLRNHSWIVYIYYLDSKIYTLTVTYVGMKEWVSDGQPESLYFYNW